MPRAAVAALLLASVLLLPAALAEAPHPPRGLSTGPGPQPGPHPHIRPLALHDAAPLTSSAPFRVMRLVGPPPALLEQAGLLDPARRDMLDPLLLQAARTAFRQAMHALFLVTDLRDHMPLGELARGAAFTLERVKGLPEGVAAPAPRLPEVAQGEALLGDAPRAAAPAAPALAAHPVQVAPQVAEPQVAASAPALPVQPAPQPALPAPPAAPCAGAHLALECLGLHLGGAAGADAPGALASPLAEPRGDGGAPAAPPASEVPDVGAGGEDPTGGQGPDGAFPAQGTGSAGPGVGAPGSAATWHEGAALGLASAALLLPFLALYRRIARETCLRNELRRRLFERIRAAPGVSIDALAKAEGVAYQTVQHHARLLEGLGYIETWRDGARLHLFEDGGRYTPAEKQLRVLAASPASAALEALRQRPGSSPAEVARALGVSRGTARFHLARLAERGLVRLEREGARVRAWPSLSSQPSPVPGNRHQVRHVRARENHAQ